MLEYRTDQNPQRARDAAMSWRCRDDAALWGTAGYEPVKIDGMWLLQAIGHGEYVVDIRERV